MESQELPRKPYPTDVSDDEWAFVAPYLTPMTPEAPQRVYDLREVFRALRWLVHTGAPWRYLPGDLPRWPAVNQQTRRWVMERSFAWAARRRRLAQDYERLPDVVAGLHFLAFGALMLHRLVTTVAQSP